MGDEILKRLDDLEDKCTKMYGIIFPEEDKLKPSYMEKVLNIIKEGEISKTNLIRRCSFIKKVVLLNAVLNKLLVLGVISLKAVEGKTKTSYHFIYNKVD